ncbi:MAG: oligosaccharide flippase family protein, partial [Chloroflexota bacterium]|nr:oligosaccharide flippase family protein [Chloroflexota bacterium]
MGAQVLNVLAAPVVTRLYTPAEFGIFAVFISMLSIAVVPASLRYEAAIPLPNDDDTARRLVLLCFGLLAVTGSVTAIGVIVFGGALVDLMNAHVPERYLLLLPVSLVGVGAIQILGSWAVRLKSFGDIARARVTQSAAQVGTQLGLGMLHAGPIGLLLG